MNTPTSQLSPGDRGGKWLIVTADDFGFGRLTSQGIIDAHLNGPVTATSLMTTTQDHVRASVELLSQAPKLDVGLHLVLTGGGKPLCRSRGSGLTDREGNLLGNGRLWARAWTGRIDHEAVFDEIAAQASEFGKLLGRAPAYVDAHHHAHQLPVIRRALIDAIEQKILPAITRVTIEPPGMLKQVKSASLRRRAANLLGRRAIKEISQKQIRANNYYFGMLDERDLEKTFPWADYLQVLPESGVVEWVVHPGIYDQTLIGRDGYITQRARELEALKRVEDWEEVRPLLTTKTKLWGKNELG